MKSTSPSQPYAANADHAPGPHHLRFHLPHLHLGSAFGDDWFGLKAETFARFFGTPTFILLQTLLVAIWIAANLMHAATFDPYPFILLNLAFSLQAAYAAPLILLAQTRQADRDKVLADADAQHREDLANAHQERLALAQQQAEQLAALLAQNTELTAYTKLLSQRIEILTLDIHACVVQAEG
jgi:uncharacterized membrane protein